MVKFIDETNRAPVECEIVEELGLPDNGVISLKNRAGGGYSTVLPISSPEYRAEHPTKANVEITQTETRIHFDITDDYGCCFLLIVDGEETKNPIVQDAVERCNSQKNKK